MDLRHIKENDWIEFEDRHLAAYMFLLGRSLKNEYEMLCRTSNRNDWQEERLKDLRTIFESQTVLKTL